MKIDARLKELGKECADIIPNHFFSVSFFISFNNLLLVVP